MKRDIKTYIFDKSDSAYLNVAVQLRRLLFDDDSAASFTKNKRDKCLFELFYGDGEDMLLQSFRETQADKKRTGTDNYVPVTSNIYSYRPDILFKANQDNNLVSLPNWLNECFVHTDGVPQKLCVILDYIADKEGAHSINPKKNDIRTGAQAMIISGPITPADLSALVPSLDFPDHWAQLIIDAGMRLLNTRRVSDKNYLIKHDIVAPKRLTGTIMQLEKKCR